MFLGSLSGCQQMGPDWPNVPSEHLGVNTLAETSPYLIFRDRYMGLSLEIVLFTVYLKLRGPL